MAVAASLAATGVGGAQETGARERGANAPLAAAPPPNSPALVKSGAELTAALEEARAGASGQASAPVSNTDQYRINVIQRTRGAAPLAHAGNTELHHIMDGAATVVTGGTIVRSPSGATVEGGTSRRVTKGDVILVPADTPHWYKEVEGTVTYLEVRWVAARVDDRQR
jgi:mannose-6-phosphate isomerase-like protein (cupin superfamily)